MKMFKMNVFKVIAIMACFFLPYIYGEELDTVFLDNGILQLNLKNGTTKKFKVKKEIKKYDINQDHHLVSRRIAISFHYLILDLDCFRQKILE